MNWMISCGFVSCCMVVSFFFFFSEEERARAWSSERESRPLLCFHFSNRIPDVSMPRPRFRKRVDAHERVCDSCAPMEFRDIVLLVVLFAFCALSFLHTPRNARENFCLLLERTSVCLLAVSFVHCTSRKFL